LTAVQLELIYRLSEAYNVTFNQRWVRKVLALILGSLTPVLVAPSISGLLRYVPVVGQSLGLAGGSLSFATATYLVGHAFAKRFAKGESIDDQEVKTIAKEIKDGFESSKAKVKGLFSGSKPAAEEASEA
jgi:uncharacterized protein (DUF697 family)